MRQTKRLAGAILMIGALCALGASNALAALEFKDTGMGYLVAKAVTNQVLSTKAGTITCTNIAIEAVAASEAELNPEWQLAVVNYSGCTAFGFITVEPFKAMLDFNINGFFRIESEFVIRTTGCIVHVAGYPENQKVSNVGYVNHAGKVELVVNATKIMSYGEGINCTYALEEAGTYKGESMVELPGFEISA